MLITHNMGLVAEMANDVAVMYMGQVIESGTVEQIFENPCHPYTRALMQSVPVLGMEPGKRLASISGQTPARTNWTKAAPLRRAARMRASSAASPLRIARRKPGTPSSAC